MSSAHLTKLKRKAAELEQKKQFEKALGLYIQVIEEAGRDLDDVDLQLFNRVGDLLMRQNNVSEALAYYEKAVDVYAERGFLNNAIALCNKILRQSPARAAVYYKLGKISASKGFKTDARKNFLEYADRMQKAGHLDEAFRALKEFADICPDQDDIRLMLADLLTRENRTQEAVEQLEQLYAKLESEGRAAEARATMDRIKAIDPEVTPRITGTWQAQKSNDLVFLDLADGEFQAAPAATPRAITPVTPNPAVERIDVSGHSALHGLAITFLPDDESAPTVSALGGTLSALEGLEVTDNGGAAGLAPTDHIADLEPPVTLESVNLDEVVGLPVDHPEFTTPDEVVPPEVGLASPVVTLTGAHPSLAPLLDEPVLTGQEFGSLHLEPSHDAPELPRAHDLALESTLPLLASDDDMAREDGDVPAEMRLSISAPGLVDETPDEWVAAALDAKRDNFSIDRLLTPLDNRVIGEPPGVVPDLVLSMPDDAGADATAAEPVTGSFSVDELLAIPDAPLPGLTLNEAATSGSGAVTRDHEGVAGATSENDAFDEVPRGEGPDDVAASTTPPEPACAERLESRVDEVPDGTRADASTPADLLHEGGEPAEAAYAPGTGDDAAAIDQDADAPPSWPARSDRDKDVASLPPAAAWSEGSALPPEFALEQYASGGTSETVPSALDTAALRAELDAARADEAPPAREGTDPLLVRSAFEEERVELPLIDLEASSLVSNGEPPLPKDGASGLDDLLAAAPSFGDGNGTGSFEPEPLDLSAQEHTDEWATPEVLIDGEWRDEHVGDLVSGEMFVVGERRDADPPRRPHFDDLSAAMLYDGDEDAPVRAPTPSVPQSFSVGAPTPRGTLSFGGVEAQLRRRLELSPSDTALRRQLGEALLDAGDREQGLNELEVAVLEYEGRNDLEAARSIVDVILRVVPLSVRHHQKRVEYAVRASDRVRLIEAYTELADALFRCGEPDKARVVYSRVLELAPTSDRARFALSMLADDAGLPRSSDEVPTIDTGILSGTPSLAMATLTPEALDALTRHNLGALGNLPLIATGSVDGGGPAAAAPDQAPAPEPRAEEELDEEVDAAFDAEPAEVKEARRRTSELDAIEEWAAAQVPNTAPEPAPASGDFIDLGEWLRSTEPEKSTRMVAADVAPTGDERADFAEMLRRFKQGVAANVDEEDFASHYDLGVAYKEMGLVDEAVAQFQRALRGPEHRIQSYEALGQCFVEQGQYPVALALLRRAVEGSGTDDQRLVGVLYLLGFASESVGRQDDAVGYYQRVFAVDIQFRDVASRLAALARDAK